MATKGHQSNLSKDLQQVYVASCELGGKLMEAMVIGLIKVKKMELNEESSW